jgi:hypothetical protein
VGVLEPSLPAHCASGWRVHENRISRRGCRTECLDAWSADHRSVGPTCVSQPLPRARVAKRREQCRGQRLDFIINTPIEPRAYSETWPELRLAGTLSRRETPERDCVSTLDEALARTFECISDNWRFEPDAVNALNELQPLDLLPLELPSFGPVLRVDAAMLTDLSISCLPPGSYSGCSRSIGCNGH